MKKTVYIRDIPIGGDNRVTIQTMTNTDTHDWQATIKQVQQLHDFGADIVRVSVPTLDCVNTIKKLSKLNIPIVGDIHFDYKIALATIKNGVDKIRINPSNISAQGMIEIIKACRERQVPIRVGVNKGSIKNHKILPEQLAYFALENAKIIEKYDYDNIVLAVKTSSTTDTVTAYRALDKLCNYPLHVGLTEAGTKRSGTIKSAVAIGSLLMDNIGDTIRVSLATDPIEEIKVATEILRASGKEKNFVEIIACPTCGRTEKNIDIEHIASQLEEKTRHIKKSLKIAVMGCVVNGIGESEDADFGVAGGREKSIIFADGKAIKTIDNHKILPELMTLMEKYIE